MSYGLLRLRLCKIYLQLDLKGLKSPITNKNKELYVFKAKNLLFKAAKLTSDMKIRSNVERTNSSINICKKKYNDYYHLYYSLFYKIFLFPSNRSTFLFKNFFFGVPHLVTFIIFLFNVLASFTSIRQDTNTQPLDLLP
jgi:hypothetical protein